MHRTSLTRRDFLAGTTAAGLLGGLPVSSLAARDKVRVAVIGCGNRGSGHVNWVEESGGVVLATCDPDIQRAKKAANRAKRDDVKAYQDYRKILDDDSIDAVVIATPNHWHATLTVHACQAGKDVYVEKPVSHNVWEGRKMVEAAHKHDRIVQAGTQQRSDPALIATREALAKKRLGEVKWIHALWYANRGPIGDVKRPQSVPGHIDYNLWCGPRPLVPLRRKSFHYDWHWFWPYGNGDMGNRVIHNIDDIHHVMRMGDRVPSRVMGVGGRFKYDDDATTPNTELVVMDWDVPIVFGSRNMPYVDPDSGKKTDAPSAYHKFGRGFRFINLIQCEEGYIAVARGGGQMFDQDGNKIENLPGDGGQGHMKNFLEAVQSRKRGHLNAPIEESHRSSTMLHTGNISYRIGGPASVEDVRSQVSGLSEAEEAWKQTVEHLRHHDVNPSKEKPTLGPWLTFNAEKERFEGDRADIANTLVKETYRRPFDIPEKV